MTAFRTLVARALVRMAIVAAPKPERSALNSALQALGGGPGGPTGPV